MILAIAATENDWFGKMLYSLGKNINSAIYYIVSLISEGLLNIANTQMFSGGLEAFTKRIYVILGVYMLFKLAFSLLSSVINPDVLLDKEKGMQKIIPRTIVMLILLIMVPTIFSEALNLQAKIIPVIPKIIIGKSVDSSNNNGANYGENMASMALGAFILKNDECKPKNSSTNNTNNTSDTNDTSGESETLAGYTVSSMLKEGTKACESDSKLFAYDFNWLMSAIVGIILVVILFFYAIDVAIRLLKLAILQLLAPIPIISYIDPKSSKDGAFASWLKLSISTYLDLFIKLAMFYFVIFILSGFASGDVNFITMPDGLSAVAKAYVTIMILVGALFFLMQGPKFIYGMLGIKNPNQGVGLAGALAGTAALVGGAGFMGAAAAATKSMSETSQAAGQGKQAPSGWGTGSDLAAQLRTGDQKAKGGLINNYVRSASRSAQQRTAARTLASRFGITQQGLDDAKSLMYLDQDNADAMQLAYQRGENSYREKYIVRDANGNAMRDARGNVVTDYRTKNFSVDQNTGESLALQDIAAAKTQAATSKGNYDKANKIAERYGLDQTMEEKYRTSLGQRIADSGPGYTARRVASHVTGRPAPAEPPRLNSRPNRQDLGDRLGGHNNWNSGV